MWFKNRRAKDQNRRKQGAPAPAPAPATQTIQQPVRPTPPAQVASNNGNNGNNYLVRPGAGSTASSGDATPSPPLAGQQQQQQQQHLINNNYQQQQMQQLSEYQAAQYHPQACSPSYMLGGSGYHGNVTQHQQYWYNAGHQYHQYYQCNPAVAGGGGNQVNATITTSSYPGSSSVDDGTSWYATMPENRYHART